MFFKLLLFFISVPLIELAILIKLIGVLETIWIVIATGVLGAYLVRRQGMSVLMSIQGDLSNNRIPSESLMDGVMIIVSAVLLLTPGLLTDFAGFLLLIPRMRSTVKTLIRKRIEKKLDIIDISPET